MGKQKGVDAALELANHLSAYRSYLLLSSTRSCWAGHEALESVDEILWPHGVSSRSIKLNSSRSLWTRKFSLLRIMSRNACRKGTHGCLFFSVSKLVSKGFYDDRRVSSSTGQVHHAAPGHSLDRLGQDILETSRLYVYCSLERHGTRALVTVGRGHVTRGIRTQSIA